MAKNNTKRYIAEITDTLKAGGKYNEGLALNIRLLAQSLAVADKCMAELMNADSLISEGVGSKGQPIAKPHPAFKLLMDASEAVDRRMKQIGLTGKGGIEEDTPGILEGFQFEEDE